MDDGKLSVVVSDHRREFIEEELAAGVYADEAEIVDAALALLERSKKIGVLKAMIDEADAQFERGEYRTFDETDDLTRHIVENAESLRRDLAKAGASGETDRQIPDIMNAVKTKLRANGTL